MLLNNPQRLVVSLLAACLVLFYNSRILSTSRSYYAATETVISSFTHDHAHSPLSSLSSSWSSSSSSSSLSSIPSSSATSSSASLSVTSLAEPTGSSSIDADATLRLEAASTAVPTKEAHSSSPNSATNHVHQPIIVLAETNDAANTTSHESNPAEVNPAALTHESTTVGDALAPSKSEKEAADHKELWAENRKPFFNSSRVAFIIEDRPLSNLIPLMLHFSTVLGSNWPIVLFTHLDQEFPSAPLQRAIEEKRIFIRKLPDFVEFDDHASVSKFLTKPWIWNQLAPADRVLMFQTDSMICSNSPQTIEEFLKYDFVGAPINPKYGNGYNGGLSLRNRKMLLNIIHSSNFTKDNDVKHPPMEDQFEDQWFHKKMRQLPRLPNGSPAANLPHDNVAMKFAVETIDYEFPLGYHQPGRWQKDNMEQIEEWCPEIRLCTQQLLVNDNKTPDEMEEAELTDEQGNFDVDEEMRKKVNEATTAFLLALKEKQEVKETLDWQEQVQADMERNAEAAAMAVAANRKTAAQPVSKAYESRRRKRT